LKQQLETALAEEKARATVEYQRLDQLYHTVDSEWKTAQQTNRELLAEKHDLGMYAIHQIIVVMLFSYHCRA